jgi:hypothetical protein
MSEGNIRQVQNCVGVREKMAENLRYFVVFSIPKLSHIYTIFEIEPCYYVYHNKQCSFLLKERNRKFKTTNESLKFYSIPLRKINSLRSNTIFRLTLHPANPPNISRTSNKAGKSIKFINAIYLMSTIKQLLVLIALKLK